MGVEFTAELILGIPVEEETFFEVTDKSSQMEYKKVGIVGEPRLFVRVSAH